ncbi:MAG: lamin tail domain-containing protein [Pirellulales bacterium]
MRIKNRRCVEQLEPRLTLDSTVVFNEVMYHPAGDGTPEWIELHNQMAVDMDLSAWRLRGGVNFDFPSGTIIPRQGYLVISADPAALAAHGFAGALGPWTGSLDNDGERIDLMNNSDRLLNRLDYGDEGAWPVAADGTGVTLAKRNENAASDAAANWTWSGQRGGTPGEENFPPAVPVVVETTAVAIEGTWRYRDDGVDLGASWKNAAFDDTAWSSGNALFYDETASLPAAKNTPLTPGQTTYYFRTSFAFSGDPSQTQLQLRPVVDDGAVYYLNGVEVYRQNMPAGPIGYDTLSTGVVGDAQFAGPFVVDAPSLVVGQNVLAVEVHQGPQGGSNYSETILGANPVAYWRLGETSTASGAVLDSASNAGPPQAGAQNGTFAGFNPANLGTAGPRPTDLVGAQPLLGFESDNRAPDFQGANDGGNDVVLIPDTGSLNFATNRRFTLEAWVKAPQGAPQEGGGAILAKGLGGGGEQFAIDLVNGAYRFFLWNGGAPNTPSVIQSSASPNGQWQHVVGTFDSAAGIMRLYVNGQQVGATTPPATIVNTTHDVSIGARKNQNSSNYDLNFDGQIDEVAIYDRALSPAEVTAHFQAAFVSGGGVGPALDDVAFGVEAVTQETLPDAATVRVSMNEVAASNEQEFWLELINRGGQSATLDGYVLQSFGAVDAEHVLSGVTIPAGQRRVITDAELGFKPAVGDRLVLYFPGRAAVADAVAVDDRLRGRSPEATGEWRFPDVATPGAANSFDFRDEIVVNEIMYHARPMLPTPGTPATFATTTLLAIDAATDWRYNATGTDLGTNWYQTQYTTANAGWQEGPAPIGYELDSIPIPIRTEVTNPASPPANPFIRTYYFQTTFDVTDPSSIDALHVRHMIDDGAVFYLNGVEVDALRFNMPGNSGDPVPYATIASVGVGEAALVGPITVDPSLLVAGTNVLSVEVHQAGTATSSDIVLAVEVSAAVQLTPPIPGTPFAENPDEWIEIYNRGTTPIDLGGWKLKEAVQYEFPGGTTLQPGEYLVVASDVAAFAAAHPGVAVVGPFGGSLSNSNERVLLDDAVGNPADEVHYFDGGRWPALADGSGASLELRDADADNAFGESWAASDEAALSQWHTYTYRGIAETTIPGSPTLWREFALGMLDGEGEVWLDDISVIETPSTTPIERIQNGDFSAGAAHWRLLGNHQRSQVVAEPGNAANAILRLVASGATEYQGNQIETTLGGGATIVDGREYEISFRAKWIAGASQLNTRLYFNRLARTTPLIVPTGGGTPGAANSTRVANAGPTYDDLLHAPAVPEAGQPVTVSARAEDPDAVASMTLRYSIGGGPFVTTAMTLQADGRYAGTIPGQSASALVQFYVEGQDAQGATSTFPAAGPNSRALVRWNDGQASTGLATNFRILMTQADTDLLHLSTNTTSNERLGATIIYDEGEIFYDTGVRLKGSFVGRDVGRVGFNISFNPDQLFRGVHDKVSVDRSQTATAISPTEMLLFQIANQAGGNLPSRYDDLIYVIAPRSAQTSIAHLRMAGYDSLFLDEQFENGSEGNVYEFEVLRWATTTVDGNAESIKRSAQSGNGYDNVDFQNLGADKEDYRWLFLLTNNRTEDDYSDLIPAVQTFSLSGAALDAAVEQYLDVDQWMRVFAHNSLGGVRDAYNWDNHHNMRVYTRPDDGKLLALPWDWDNLFNAPTGPLFGGANLGKIISRPQNLRLFYGHLQDIIARSFNTSYMAYWTNHYGQVAGRDFSGALSYINQRATYVQSQLPAQVPFVITTNGGADFSVDQPTATIEGNGWINVREIRLAGNATPLAVQWLDVDSWQVTIPLSQGENPLTLEAVDFQGTVVASDTINVTSTATTPVVEFLRISELMYHPADPTAAELAAGFVDSDEFEFIEFVNVSATETLDLAGVALLDAVSYSFGATTLPPGARIVLAVDPAAFAQRYGTSIPVAGQYSGRLNNAGEHVLLADGRGATILDFTYDDTGPLWHPTTDGLGYSLVIVDEQAPTSSWNDGASWRPSFELGGSPGSPELMAGDANGDLRVDLIDLAIVQGAMGTTSGAVRSTGDLNGDGGVDRADVAILAHNFGRAVTLAPTPPAAVVAHAREASLIAREPGPSPKIVAVRRRKIVSDLADRTLEAMMQVTPRSTSQADKAPAHLRARRRL